jgi:hypothetical protein
MFDGKKELEQDKLASQWDERKTFDWDRSGLDYEDKWTTLEAGQRLKRAGVDVNYVYYPCNLVFNDHDQKVAKTVASRPVQDLDEVVSFMLRTPLFGTSIFLMAFLDQRKHYGCYKIRYFTFDPKVKL